jgi:hypothetical protein
MPSTQGTENTIDNIIGADSRPILMTAIPEAPIIITAMIAVY